MAVTVEERLRRVEEAVLLLPVELREIREAMQGQQKAMETQNGSVRKLYDWRDGHLDEHRRADVQDKVAEALKAGGRLTLSRGWKIILGAISVTVLVLGGIGSAAGVYAALHSGEELVLCRDFHSQSAAQRYFDQHPRDVWLDPDSDGIACEELP